MLPSIQTARTCLLTFTPHAVPIYPPPPLFPAGLELLYQPEAVRLYLSLLTCSQNHNTLEAAAGALQNLAAGQWAVSGRNEIFFNLHSPPVRPR